MLKKIILKIKAGKAQAQKMRFWQWIARRQKIRCLAIELKRFEKEIKTVSDSNFIRIYHIAQEQQKLLQKKY